MTKLRTRNRQRIPHQAEGSKNAVPCECAESDNDAYFSKYSHFSRQIRNAIVTLFRRRPVGGRCRPDYGGYIAVPQFEAVIPMGRRGLVCKPSLAESSKKPISTTVTGKDPAGAVSAMCGRGETHDKKPRARITESRKGPCPIILAAISCGRVGGHLLPPFDQPRTNSTVDYLSGDLRNRIRHN